MSTSVGACCGAGALAANRIAEVRYDKAAASLLIGGRAGHRIRPEETVSSRQSIEGNANCLVSSQEASHPSRSYKVTEANAVCRFTRFVRRLVDLLFPCSHFSVTEKCDERNIRCFVRRIKQSTNEPMITIRWLLNSLEPNATACRRSETHD